MCSQIRTEEEQREFVRQQNEARGGLAKPTPKES